MLLPLSSHTEVVWRINEQIEAKKPLRKNLWRQLVQAKIRAQANNLPDGNPARTRMLGMALRVKSGDPTNMEAQAAKVYWSAWLGNGVRFQRSPAGKDPLNVFLNYGYTVIRAAAARAIVSAGLLPALGLHHANRSNPFCLADDLMEPLRPLVDARVRELHANGCEKLDRESKGALLELLTARVHYGKKSGPLMVAFHSMTASLVRCFEGKEKAIQIPLFDGVRTESVE